MGTKLTLTQLSSLANQTTAINQINANSIAIENIVDLLVSRNGTSPNTLTANLDINSKRLLNVPNAATAQEPATKAQLDAASSLTIGDASTTNYTATGTGAVEQTVQAKLDEVISVADFGVTGDGVTNDTAALLVVLQFLRDRGPSAVLTLPSLTAYQGGRLFFPKGTYVLDFDTFEIDDILNLTLIGEGGGVEQNFFTPVTRLVFTGTSSGYGLRVVHNGARQFKVCGLGIEYADVNFTGDLVQIENLAGFSFNDVAFQHQREDPASRVYSAASLVNLIGDSKIGAFDVCSFDEADKGVISTAEGGNEPKSISFRKVFFNDLQTAQVDVPNGEQSGWAFLGCGFNPVNLVLGGTPVVNGLILGGSGYIVKACIFAGATTAKVPSASFADLSGTGVFEGNFISSDGTGVVTRGAINLSNNRYIAKVPWVMEAGSFVTGSGNVYSPLNTPAEAISIAPSSGSVVANIGPDTFGAGFTESYKVETDNASVNGTIAYARGKDASTNGPVLLSEHITLKGTDTEVFTKPAGYTVLKEETGSTYNNAGASGTATFTLPTAVAGLEYKFYKFDNFQMDLATAGGGDVFIKAAAAGDATLSNVSNELGAVVKIKAVSSNHWLVESMTGTWT